MDISVSRLNNRLALQLPVELPLGLVFVMGQVCDVVHVTNMKEQDEQVSDIWFKLQENHYHLQCVLSARAATEVNLVEGNRIRAGGHLIFNAREANYYLLARDVEVVETEMVQQVSSHKQAGRTALTPILADIKKRSEAAQIAQAELPVWVQRMAPPEVQAEMDANSDEEATAVSRPLPNKSEDILNEELVTFLSDAIEDLEDVEVTTELLEDMAPGITTEPLPTDATLYEIPPPIIPPLPAAGPTPAAPPSTRREPDWSIILLIVSFIILTAACLLTILVLVLR